MPPSDSTSLAFIPSSDSSSSNDLPPLDEDEELWEMFRDLVFEHKAKFTENLDNSLDTLLLFAALFSAVNVGILALSLPTLTPDAIKGTNPAVPSAQPSKYSMRANRIFASCLTCSLIAAFFSLLGKQWLTHYKRLPPTTQMENRMMLQRQLDGTIRWHFEEFVEVWLTALLQVVLIFFVLEWISYLHWQGNRVSFPVDGLTITGGFLLLAMFACASWDRWCPFQTPYTTTIPQAFWTLVLRYIKIRVDFSRVVEAARQAISGLRFHPPTNLLKIFRRLEEIDEVMDIKSLCWMLENAPRGPHLLLVAQHISNIRLSKSQGAEYEWIMVSPHLFRLHEMFWHLLMKIKRTSRKNPANANDNTEILEHLAILGRVIVCTSPQWTDRLLPQQRMVEIFKYSFEKCRPRNATLWEEIYPFLLLQVSCTAEGGDTTYYYRTTVP